MSYKKLDLNIQNEEPFLIDDNINLKSFLKEMEQLNNENYENSLNLLTEAEYNNEVNRYNTNNAEYTTDSNNLGLYVNANDLSTLYNNIQTDESNIGNTLSISDFTDMVNYLNYDNRRIIELGNSNISLSIEPKSIGSYERDGVTYVKYRGGYQYTVQASFVGFPIFHIRTAMLDDLNNVFISKFSNLKIETNNKTISCGFNGSFNCSIRRYNDNNGQYFTTTNKNINVNDCLSPTLVYTPFNRNQYLSEYGFYITLFTFTSDNSTYSFNTGYDSTTSDVLALRSNFMWGTKRPQMNAPYSLDIAGLADIEYNAYNMCEGDFADNDVKNPAYCINITPNDITYTITIFYEYTQEE